MRSIALALLVLVGCVALGFGGRALMEDASDPDDPCIGCGLVVLTSIGVGVVGAGATLALTWDRGDRRGRPGAGDGGDR